MRIKVVGGSVCLEREGERTEREREREREREERERERKSERWKVCAERGKQCVLKYSNV